MKTNMIGKNVANKSRNEQVLYGTASALAIGLIGYAFYLTASLSLFEFLLLASSTLVTILVAGFRLTIPGTRINADANTVAAFWGGVSLGPVGGILLAATAAITGRLRFGGRDKHDIFDICSDIGASFIGAVIYGLALTNFTDRIEMAGLNTLLVPNEVIISALLMAAAHFSVKAALLFVRQGTEAVRNQKASSWDEVAAILSSYPVSILGTILLFLVFRHYGFDFGLVIVPLVVIGNVAYKIHLRSLAVKTHQIREASRLHLATVEALATAIDARDQVGTGHVRRTQIYAVGLGRLLGLSEDEISALRAGALLHDIGKLAVPDHILNKPGRLTPAEMEKMKIHASVGASILEKVGFTYPVVPTVKYHHESWDGTGYPEGLKGKQIPITARILTIADAFDTLRGDRPYRAAITREEACDFLRSRAGSQYDPALVQVFIKNLKALDDEIAAAGLSYENTLTAEGQAEERPSYVEQIQRANHEVFTLFSLALEFSSSLNLGETLSLFTQKVAAFVPYDTCVVYLLDESDETARAAFVDGQHKLELTGKRIRVGEGATGYVLKKRASVDNVDPSLDFAFSDMEAVLDFTAMTSLPLIAEEKLIGAVSLYSNSVASYQDEHLRLLETVSRIAADAIEKALRHAEAQAYALTDPMTGLPNSRSLQIEFDKEVMRAGRGGTTFQLLVLDLDGFKSVNDTYGHRVGDDMLREIAKLIRGQLREYDFLARYGGDEFVAIVPDTDMTYMERLRRRIEDTVGAFAMPVGGDKFAQVGISFGSASFPTQGQSFDELVVVADKAMYRSKAINRLRSSRTDVDTEELIPVRVLEIEDLENMPVPRPLTSPFLSDDLAAHDGEEQSIISFATIT